MTLELVCRVARKPGITLVLMACGTLVYYHCAILQTTLVSLICDVLLVILCSFAVLGLMFRHLTVSVPVDPLEWQVSQETASGVAEFMANTIGAAASVLRVAASGRDNKLFFKAVLVLYVLSAVGRAMSGATVTYAALCLASMTFFVSKLLADVSYLLPFINRRSAHNTSREQES
ncbi:reticulon-like protein B23 [Cryptomeria japonica]|uniref:reticulon-like protein B23 n=1 Tax=Cryptomeria japonica TaxID=3369 RepID=UPI0025AB71A6|nr:reticulon-like protein B23 [Cryptomeria japonica]